MEESIIKIISAEAEAEALLGLAELGNIITFTKFNSTNVSLKTDDLIIRTGFHQIYKLFTMLSIRV